MGKKNISLVDEWLTKDKLFLVECWNRDGITLTDLAKKIGISPATVSLWKSKYPAFKKALEKGKEIIDYKVENALLKSALGYDSREIKIYTSYPDKQGNVRVRKEETIIERQPNVTACMAWLNNRKPNEWKRNRDNNLELDDKGSNITVNIVRQPKEPIQKKPEPENNTQKHNDTKDENKKVYSKKNKEIDIWDEWEQEENE